MRKTRVRERGDDGSRASYRARVAESEREEKENEKGVMEVGHGHPGPEPISRGALERRRDQGTRGGQRTKTESERWKDFAGRDV